jgi:hypothetical protein
VGGVALINRVWVDDSQLSAVVPSGLPVGVHDLFMTNPSGVTAMLAGAFTVVSTEPVITEVRPVQGLNDVPVTLNIYGVNFTEVAVVRLDSQSLTTTYIDGGYLRAIVPAGVAPGVYEVTVDNQSGQTAIIEGAYTAVERSADDLYGHSDQIWTDPVSPRAGEPVTVGLVVNRQGGTETIEGVVVRLAEGQTTLGTGNIAQILPDSNASTSPVGWTPSTPGVYVLTATIDPDNLIAESNEDNNVISRSLSVLPPATDQTPPVVESFAINHGDKQTQSLTVNLSVTASDPLPGSGVQSILYQEYEFSQGAGAWLAVKSSGWLDFGEASNGYTWTLLPSAGVKYLQAWVADPSGNVSQLPAKALINYVPPTEALAADEARLYRYSLNVGDQLTATLTSTLGDADLYVWSPTPNQEPWVSNLEGAAVDSITLFASQSGVYQVEVWGYVASEYQIDVEIMPAVQTRAALQGMGRAGKPTRAQPLVNLVDAPIIQQGLPTAPIVAPRLHLYVPILSR